MSLISKMTDQELNEKILKGKQWLRANMQKTESAKWLKNLRGYEKMVDTLRERGLEEPDDIYAEVNKEKYFSQDVIGKELYINAKWEEIKTAPFKKGKT